MAPGRQAAEQQQTDQQQEVQSAAATGPLTIRTTDGRMFDAVGAVPDSSSEPESTDTVAERLDGAFSPDIVDEVKKYGKPDWEVTDSQLDPIDDIETYYEYDFKLPPAAHDAYAAAADVQIANLEAMRQHEITPELQQQVEQRRRLVQDKTAEELRWMKHKAYYTGVSKIRAAKQALQQALDEDLAAQAAAAAAADAGSTGPKQQQQGQQGQQQQQQQQPTLQPSKLSLLSEEELLAEMSDPSEWDNSYLAPSYQQHPAVQQQLCSSFASALGLHYLTPQEMQQQQQHWQELAEVAEAEQRRDQELQAAREAFWEKHKPFQAYTPEYVARQKRQQQLDAHRRHKQQAFWLSLGVALGSSAVRWWCRRGSRKQQQQQQQQRGSQRRQQQGGGSRRSTRPP